jgi:hypothetical protein
LKENKKPIENKEKDENSESNRSEKPDPSLVRFKKLLSGFDLDIEEDQESEHDKSKQTKSKSTENHIQDKVIDHNGFKYLQSNKKRIKKILGAAIGLIFVISGLILITTSALRVVDNVIFGERAMFSVFLILIGLLILATVFSKKLLENKYFKKLHIQFPDHEDNVQEKKDIMDDKDKM